MMETETYTAYALARLAECGAPDSMESAGAVFLRLVESSTREAMAWAIAHDEPTEPTDLAHEVADGAAPIYTHELWSTFVDLAAYQEDPTELGHDGADMEQGARVCLYMIAERLAAAIISELDDDDEEGDA